METTPVTPKSILKRPGTPSGPKSTPQRLRRPRKLRRTVRFVMPQGKRPRADTNKPPRRSGRPNKASKKAAEAAVEAAELEPPRILKIRLVNSGLAVETLSRGLKRRIIFTNTPAASRGPVTPSIEPPQQPLGWLLPQNCIRPLMPWCNPTRLFQNGFPRYGEEDENDNGEEDKDNSPTNSKEDKDNGLTNSKEDKDNISEEAKDK